MFRIFGLWLLQTLPIAQIEQRCEIANALSPLADFIGGNVLGLTPMVAVVLGLVLAFAMIILATTRSVGFPMKALGFLILGAMLVTVMPSVIGTVGPEAC